MSEDKNTHQELSVSAWYSIKVTAIISVFRQMIKSRLCNLVHKLLCITFHRRRRGPQRYVWINVLLCEIRHFCWVNVTSFLGTKHCSSQRKDLCELWRAVAQTCTAAHKRSAGPNLKSLMDFKMMRAALNLGFLVHRDVHLTLEEASSNCSRKQEKKRAVMLLGRETALSLGGSLNLLKSGTAASNTAQDVSVPSAVHTPTPLN